MKLIRINDSTAKDGRYVFFKEEIKTAHITWQTCPECKKRVNVIWVAWPNKGLWVCDNCIEWSED